MRVIWFAMGSAAMVSAVTAHGQDAPASMQAPASMHLICTGGTVAQLPTGQTTSMVTTSRGAMAIGSSVSTQPGFVPLKIQFRMSQGKAQLNVPAFAGVRANADGGWSEVKKLYVSDDEITGKVSTGWIGSSQFRIDRRTGEMTSSGGFRGDCKKIDQADRQF